MSIQSPTTLSNAVLNQLQTLIQANLDSYDGLKHAAQKLDAEDHWVPFFELAFQRGLHAERLRKIVAVCGVQPAEEGTVLATAHRCWTDLKSAITGGNQKAILNEALRGERYIKELYEEVLKETAGEATTRLLNEQYAAVKQGNDFVTQLLDDLEA